MLYLLCFDDALVGGDTVKREAKIEAANDAAAQTAADAITANYPNASNPRLYFTGSTSGTQYPSSSTDTAIAVWDGISGKKFKNSPVKINASGDMSSIRNISASGSISGNSLSANGAYINGYLYIGCPYIYDNNGSLTFYDSYAGSQTLADLAGGGSSLWYDSGSELCPNNSRNIYTYYDIGAGGSINAGCPGFSSNGYTGRTGYFQDYYGNYIYVEGGIIHDGI